MPELPEVETLCRQLRKVVCRQQICDVTVLDPRLGGAEFLRGRSIEGISRRGKFIGIALDHRGRRCRFPSTAAYGRTGAAERAGDMPREAWLHLRMTGRLLWTQEAGPMPPYTRMVVSFTDGKLLLIDPRRFATLSIEPPPSSLSPADPMMVKADELLRVAVSRQLPVKVFLMDQRFLAGIGNIYACEILHAAGIGPHRPAGSLRKPEWRAVARAIKAVLKRAIACRGTSISDWRDCFGTPGTNQRHLGVYGREDLPCKSCGTIIRREKIGGRGTWYCPSCQS